MEVLEQVGTPQQKKEWLEPLLNGEIRSAYVMTEPMQPSSDAKNISTTAVLDGDEWVINGEKYWISNVADPRCKIMIVMVKTSPDAAHRVGSNRRFWYRRTPPAWRSSDPWTCSATCTRRTATCT